jgi:DNA-binding XRE family transcriptional regulator
MKRSVSKEVALEIYKKMLNGERKVFLAEQYGISKKTLYNIERKMEAYAFLKEIT